MNIREGARRIQKVGRLFLAFAAAALVFVFLVAVIANFTTTFHLFPLAALPLLIVFALYPGMIGTAFMVVGWIVEGFATPILPPTPNTPASGD